MWQLKRDYPSLPVVLNGGLKSVADAHPHWSRVDGVMLGRDGLSPPAVLSELAVACGLQATPTDAEAVYDGLIEYVGQALARGERMHSITRPRTGSLRGRPGARAFRRTLSGAAHRADAGLGLLAEARRAACEKAAA